LTFSTTQSRLAVNKNKKEYLSMETKKDQPVLEVATAEEGPTISPETKALAAVMAAQETATLNTKLESAEEENKALQAKLEEAETARDTAVKELADLKAAIELKETATARAAAVKKVSPSLLEGEEATARIERWAKMEEASFEDFLSVLTTATATNVREASFSSKAAESATVTARTSTTNVDAVALATAALREI
jgi:predicted  nucleic acid-binding Zn-ribbon protein